MQLRFRHELGYAGNFEQPRSYQEKVQYRKLYGNHEFYALVADKFAAREYVAERVGEQYLIPLLGIHDRLSPEILECLPSQFIIKATHGCKWQKIVRDKEKLDVAKTVKYFNRMMNRRYGRTSGEYHYSLIQPRIMIEELLLDQGEIPCDYNLFCCHSSDGFDFALAIAFPEGTRFVYFDKHWNRWEGELTKQEEEKLIAPKNFDEMVDIARTLSSDFDFVRIDLYNIDGQIFFGEITCTPAAGFKPMNEFRNAKFTELWKMDLENDRLYSKPNAIR